MTDLQAKGLFVRLLNDVLKHEMKILILFSTSFFLCFPLFGQLKITEPKFLGKDRLNRSSIDTYIAERISSDSIIVNSFCQRLSCALTFQINEQGDVVSIDTSEGTPDYLSEKFIQIIDSTSYMWEPMTISNKRILSKPIILIFDLSLQFGCRNIEARDSSDHDYIKSVRGLFNFKNINKQEDQFLDTYLMGPFSIYLPYNSNDDIGKN